MKKIKCFFLIFTLIFSTSVYAQQGNFNQSPSKSHREVMEDYEKCEIEGELTLITNRKDSSTIKTADELILEAENRSLKGKNKANKKTIEARDKTIQNLKKEKKKLEVRELELLSNNSSQSAELKNVKEQILAYKTMIEGYEKTRTLEAERHELELEQKDSEIEDQKNKLEDKDKIFSWIQALEDNVANTYFKRFEIKPMKRKRNGSMSKTKSYSDWVGTAFEFELGSVVGYQVPNGEYFIKIKDIATNKTLFVSEGKGRAIQKVYFQNGIGKVFFPNYNSKTAFAWDSKFLVQLFYKANYENIIEFD